MFGQKTVMVKCPRGPFPKPPVCVCIWVPCSVAQSCLTLYDSPDCGPPGCPGGFSRQEYWSGVPFPSPGTLLTQGSLAPPALAGVFFTTEPPGKPPHYIIPGPVCVTDRTPQKLRHVTSEAGLWLLFLASFSLSLMVSFGGSQLPHPEQPSGEPHVVRI